MALAPWIDPVERMVERHAHRGGFLLAFPDFRPDLFQALAHQLAIPSFDYRTEVMLQHGWEADRIGLQQLDETLDDLSLAQASVVMNVESLLATKPSADRRAWFTRFTDTDRPHPLLVPVVTMHDELPASSARVHTIPGQDLPDSSLLLRMRF